VYDVAVFGSGFAGYSIAASLLEAGYNVLVVEKGPRKDFRKSIELALVASSWESVESQATELDLGVATPPRFIGLGGTSTLWSGKWRPLDKVDFLRSEDDRGWPFDQDELDSHYRAVSKRFGFSLDDDPAVETVRKHAASAGVRLVRTALSNPPTRLAEMWNGLEIAYPRLTILSDVEQLEFHINGGTIKHVHVLRSGNDSAEVSANNYVIAAGGIASAGLVRELHHTATGDLESFLGGYMDHPKGEAGILWPRKNLEHLAQLFKRKGGTDLYGLSLPEDELLSLGIGNHVVFLGRSHPVGLFRSRPIKLEVHVDQFPEGCNGIDYTESLKVRWKISAKTRRNVEMFLQMLSQRLEPLFGRVDLRTWIDLRSASHPSGCTPLSSTPSGCQIHASGRLNAISNAYCVSSSAFPFAGSANPTITVAALANRLAKQLAPKTSRSAKYLAPAI
jgi:choline dehydrogenase-like flavoprotein